MSRVAVVAFGAVSTLGRGVEAFRSGDVGAAARSGIAHDPELARAGLARPFAARVQGGASAAGLDRATVLLLEALCGCLSELDDTRPDWRRERVGLVVGTSSGAMRHAEAAFAAFARGERPADGEAATYHGPLSAAVRDRALTFDPTALVLAACASSAVAIGVAARFVERGACDLALAGGFDDVTVFVASGFEALHATTAAPPPRPFRVGRDGMSLGEGAAIVALARAPAAPRSKAFGFVTGFAATCDAVHLTAPEREGAGLARAATRALEEAGRPEVDIVGAHATATPFNDPAEAKAIARALGPDGARRAVVHPFKAQIGHTLGAAGALETLACLDAIARGVLPAAAGEGPVDPACAVRVLDHGVAGRPRVALKLAAAFGGSNAALVVADRPPPGVRAFRPAFVHGAIHAAGAPALDDGELAVLARTPVERIGRLDGLVRLALAAVGRLEQRSGSLRGAGVIVGSAYATVETNAIFAARVRDAGARAAPPRSFPYTSPNAAPGECAIAFGLTGPNFSVGGGLHAAVEAFAVAALLVESGDADRMVVVAVDEDGPITRSLSGGMVQRGAVAVLLSAEARGARAEVRAVTLQRGEPALGPVVPGHLALLPLVGGMVPESLSSATPPDALARVTLQRL